MYPKHSPLGEWVNKMKFNATTPQEMAINIQDLQ